MSKELLLSLVFIIWCSFDILSVAQTKYAGKVEVGFLKYRKQNVIYDASDNFPGYYLDNKENGIEANFINGIFLFKDRGFVGLGVGYVNFEGMSGLNTFSEFELLTNSKRISPILGLKLGYNHLWNQYEGGTGTGLVDLGIGVNCRIDTKSSIYLKSGINLVQQATLYPIRLGVRF